MASDDDLLLRQKEVMALFGSALVFAQTTERIMEAALRFVIGKPSTLEDAMAAKEKNKRKTLGMLLEAIREQSTVAPELDQRLTRFLRNRNKLAHRLHDVQGLDFHTPDGLAVAEQFGESLVRDATYIHNLFFVHVRGWETNHQFAEHPDIDQDLLAEISKVYTPLAGQIVMNRKERG